MHGHARFVEQRRRKGLGVSDIAEILLELRGGGVPRHVGSIGERRQLRVAVPTERRRDAIGLRGQEIDAPGDLVPVVRRRRLWEQGARRGDRQQVGLNVVLGHRVDTGRVDDGLRGEAGIRLEIGIVLQVGGDVGVGPAVHGVRKVAVQLLGGIDRHRRVQRSRRLPLALIADEEEQLVSSAEQLWDADRSAERGAELLSFEDRFRQVLLIVEEAVRIESVVPHEIEQAAVHVVCAGLRDHTDDAARVPAVFGRVVVLQHPKFRDRVGIGIQHYAVVDEVVVPSAVQQEADRVGSSATDAVSAARVRVRVRLDDAGQGQSEVEGIAPVQRQFLHRTTGNRAADGRVDGLDRGRVRFDGDALRSLADAQVQIDAQGLIDEQLLWIGDRAGETRMFRFDGVAADRQV